MCTPGTAEPWQALILAGGRSTRMGQDKARLPFRGGTLLDHVRAVCHDAGAARVLVSGPYPEADAIPDRVPGLGPLGGLASVLPELGSLPLILLPVDLPRLRAKDLLMLHRAAVASTARAVRFAGGHVLPLWLRPDATAAATVRAMADHQSRGARSLRALFTALAGIEIACDAATHRALEDCDTPEAWRRLGQEQGLGPC